MKSLKFNFIIFTMGMIPGLKMFLGLDINTDVKYLAYTTIDMINKNFYSLLF